MRKMFASALASWLLAAAMPVAAQAPRTPPPSQTPRPPEPAAPADRPIGYVVGRNDRIHVEVRPDMDELNRYTGDYTVGVDGKMIFPQLGATKVDGLTERGIEDLIKKELLARGFLSGDPSVTVSVLTYASQFVYVTGEVQKPGDQPLKGNEMTLLHAIAQANNFSPEAGDEIIVSHPGDPTFEPHKYSRKELAATLGDDPPVRAGDQITVSKAEMFNIHGEVRSGGQKVWQSGMTWLDAVGLAGGLNDRASRGRSYIMRKDAKAKSGYTRIGNLEDKTPVLANDQIFVEKKFF